MSMAEVSLTRAALFVSIVVGCLVFLSVFVFCILEVFIFVVPFPLVGLRETKLFKR